MKLAFPWFQIQIVVSKSFQDLPCVPFESLFIFGVEEDVVHVDDDYSFINQVLEQIVHHRLKRGRQVTHSEKHYSWFKQSSIGLECRFPLVPIPDPYVVISPSYVQFSEIFGVFDFIHKFGDQREWVGILYGPFV